MRHFLAASIAFSLFAHFLFLETNWTQTSHPESSQIVIPVSLDIPGGSKTDSAALRNAPATAEGGDQGANAYKRRQQAALKRFLKNIKKAVEARKFQPGEDHSNNMIGNAVYAFTILENDSFCNIHLVRTSDNSKLDQAAFYAIQKASGVVHRPKIIGTAPISFVLTVKYQYGM